MDVQSIILGFLMQQSMTGYDLKKAFSMSFSFFSGLSYGSIYPALKKMEKLGLISMKVEIQDGAPNRKIYTITEAGRKSFLESLQTPLVPERHKSVFPHEAILLCASDTGTTKDNRGRTHEFCRTNTQPVGIASS